MSEKTKIEWTDHTASPWHGCAEVHAGCDHCYARTMAKRNPGTLGVWGPEGTRVRSASFDANCRRWNRAAEKAGERASVFPSICDPFEDWQGPILNAKGERLVTCWGCDDYHGGKEPLNKDSKWLTMDHLRRDLFKTIDDCPWLDFYLLTKRPENIRRAWEPHDFEKDASDLEAIGLPRHLAGDLAATRTDFRPNVYLLTSISDQATADAMIPHLLACRDLVPVLGVSAEPLLGQIELTKHWYTTHNWHNWLTGQTGIGRTENSSQLHNHPETGKRLDWLIVGGESGPGARPCNMRWIGEIVKQCRAADVACFVKQLGANVIAGGNFADKTGPMERIKFRDPKGGDPEEWLKFLRVRQYPKASVKA